ncbi:uncharacterized protein L201_002862 [Kwoniella dendrophila CBS 6074]|uniref:Vacuolar protein sorting-associated protein 54 n=1 Tax=Kwoniella dendrophila CBS 6074 TaxID=1295534 RepID=A0AAX4JTR9_9TREE
MSRTGTPSQPPTSVATPVPSSPRPSESVFSDLDGTAPSILGTTYGEPSYDLGKVEGGALNYVSWKLDVNARNEDGVEKRGFNAISTVLNHPTKKANPLRSTRKPLPPLNSTSTVIPKPPPPTHYDSYLQSITPLYDSFITSQAQSSSSSSTTKVKSPILGEFDSKQSEDTINRTSSDLPSLDQIPSMFFDKDFDLSNPSIWSELINSSSTSDNKNDNDNIQTQDDLSGYLDLLERHLIYEISQRSDSFFSALTNLQELNSESNDCLSKISNLKQSLNEINEKQSRKGLSLISSYNNLHTLKLTEKNLNNLKDLEELLNVIKNLVEQNDYQGSLSYSDDLVKWWNKFNITLNEGKEEDDENSTGTSNLPLSTLPALSSLPSILNDLTKTISTQLESALSSFLITTLSKESNDSLDNPSFSSAVEPILVGLVRCGQVNLVESVWRDAVIIAVREGSRNHLPVGQQDEDDSDKPPEARGASLAQSLQSMDHSSFLLLSTQMYTSLISRIRLSQQVAEEIERILKYNISLPTLSISSHVPDSSLLSAPKVEPTVPDFNDAIISGCELAHTRASKILGVRAEQHAALGLEEFVEIFRENWEFILNTEKVAGKMIVGLRGVTASQARAFLVTYHSIRLTKSAKLVEEEQWTQIDVLPNVQHVVNLLVQSAVSDPPECAIPSPSTPTTKGDDQDSAGKKQIDIEDKSYFVVKATAESLVLLGDYLKIVINLELVVTDVMSRIIEFLKSFNSRTCQVVLGAGAMRSAGLKNITAKHLALASQSLSIIISLIPYIREFVRRHLSPKQAVMLTEFDKLKRDYQEHQNEIHAKLVAIMSDRLAVHVGSLREIDWEAAPAKDGPRQYAEMLVKETATLHKVLSKYLAASTVDTVMSEVIGAIVHRLSEEYGKIEFKSEEAKKRMLQDVALISIRLTPLSESGKDMSKLETLVKEKATPRKPIGQAMSGFLRRNGSQKGDSPVIEGDSQEKKDGQEDVEDDEDGAGLTEDNENKNDKKDDTEAKKDEASEVKVEKPEEKIEGNMSDDVEDIRKEAEEDPKDPASTQQPSVSSEPDKSNDLGSGITTEEEKLPDVPSKDSPDLPDKSPAQQITTDSSDPPTTSPPPPPEK